jgi:Ca2+-binding RTX toxin-like protein
MCILCKVFGNLGFVHAASGEFSGQDGSPSFSAANAVGVTGTLNNVVDGILLGTKWSGTITYSFPDSPSDYPAVYGNGEPTNGFSQITAAEQTVVHAAFAQIAGFTNATFQFAGTDSADIRIARSAAANPTAYAYYPSSTFSEGGDVWIGTSYAGYANPTKGDYAYLTHLHELGHSMGLKHAHESGGVSNTPVPSDRDALEYTVMSYRSYVGGSTTGGYTNEQYGYPQTYMMIDILALQTMYGADYTLNATNTVYTFSTTTGEMFINGVGQGRPGGANAPASANRVFLTIWDGGGNDTYDFSNYTNGVRIDLNPASSSITSTNQLAYLGNGHYASGNVYNAYLFNNDARSYIENAIGGSGQDVLVGNVIANRLDGGLGNDTITGGGGNDRFIFKSAQGNDTITDFVVGGTDDVIDLVGFSGLTSFTQALGYAAQVGANTVFTFTGGQTLTLQNVTKTALTNQDFLFNGQAGTVTPTGPAGVSDFNGDQYDDVLFQSSTGAIRYASMAGGNFSGFTSVTGNTVLKAIGSADFNADGYADVLVRNPSNGAVFYNNMAGGTPNGWVTVVGSMPSNWRVIGTGDFNRDGYEDVLFHKTTDNTVYYQNMAGGTAHGWGVVVPAGMPTNWSAVGAGDFNNDGYSDTLFRNSSNGTVYYHNITNNGWGVVVDSLAASYQIVGVGDYNADGYDDVLFRDSSNDSFYFKNMAGGNGRNSGWASVGQAPGWTAGAVADVNNDGYSDVVLENNADGSTIYADMSGGVFRGYHTITGAQANWDLV